MVYLGNYELDHQENAGSHLAVDIRVPQGTPIHAVANGIVSTVVEKNSGFGYYIVLEHPNVPDYPNTTKKTTLYSTYNHLGKINVKTGQVVKKGDVIALSGNTGTSTTPHLHFQIDRKDAPWHPYWPFSSQEASQAGLSFFDAINEGLNQNKAKDYTVNPMLWVQAHLNENLSANAGTSDQNNTTNSEDETKEPTLTKFKITATTKETYINESINLTITALDQNGNALEEYEPGDTFAIKSDSGSSRYPRTLSFKNGKTELNFTDIKAKEVVLSIIDQDIIETITLNFKEPPVIEPDSFNILVSRLSIEQGDKIGIIVEALKNEAKIETYTPSSEFSFKINNNEIPLKFKNGVGDLTFIADKVGETLIQVSDFNATKNITLNIVEKVIETETDIATEEITEEIKNTTEEEITEDTIENNNAEGIETEETYYLKISGEDLSLTGSPLTIIVKVYDQDDSLVKDFNPNETIPVTTSGKGILQPDNLTGADFISGVATINYLADQEEKATITVGDISFDVTFIEEIKAVAGFEIIHDTTFIPETPELITIQAIDEDGNLSPNYNSLGTVKFKLVDGAGSFTPETLTASDFKNGVAKVIFISSSDGDVKIKAQNGAIVGISRYLRADTKGIFLDVDNKHEFAEAIAYLKNNQIIAGYEDGTFKPDQTVSRVEALKMILAGMGIELTGNANIDFPDTESPSWYAEYIATALEKEIMKGYPDGTFKPGDTVIRAEYLKILLEAAGVELEKDLTVNPYYDVKRTEWYAAYAMFAKKNNLFEVTDNKLKPTQNVTRGEVADTIYKIILLSN